MVVVVGLSLAGGVVVAFMGAGTVSGSGGLIVVQPNSANRLTMIRIVTDNRLVRLEQCFRTIAPCLRMLVLFLP